VPGVCLLLLTSACGDATAPVPLEHLHACATDEGPSDALCGGLDVDENRAIPGGRRITLNIVVLPALGQDVRADPLFFLAGGPGQGAAQLAPQVQYLFRTVLRTRDIVLVDQRGTGRSHPLNCPSTNESLRDLAESEEASLAQVRRCLHTLAQSSDLRQYTTTIAMDDLDDVRAYLGYEQINLYGGSYGTRAALVYTRRHGARVRAMVLDGVAPTDMRLPLFTSRDAQRALDRLLQDCEEDAPCRAAFPGLGPRVRTLLARLDAEPARLRLAHPRTGVVEDVEVRGRLVARILFSALYSPVTASLLPTLLERAEHDDFEGLLALAFSGETTVDNMSLGMQLSVLCSEDAGRFTPGDLTREAAGSLFGTGLMIGQVVACGIWPRGVVDPAYYEPLVSDVPTLVLSGDLDPVTPPVWGQTVAARLTRSRHLVAAGTGHGVVATACGARLVSAFLEQGAAETLDAKCLETMRRPGFFLTPSGPEPASASQIATR
jgi:pimeloyl-ACP methyl ester carboxylesterase